MQENHSISQDEVISQAAPYFQSNSEETQYLLAH